jgi:hypothetical protein
LGHLALANIPILVRVSLGMKHSREAQASTTPLIWNASEESRQCFTNLPPVSVTKDQDRKCRGGYDSTSQPSKPRMRKICTRDHPLLSDATTSHSHAAAVCPAEMRSPASSDEASHVSEVQFRRSTTYPLRISHHPIAPNSKLVLSQDRWVYLRNFFHRNSRCFPPQFLIFTSSLLSCCWKR